MQKENEILEPPTDEHLDTNEVVRVAGEMLEDFREAFLELAK